MAKKTVIKGKVDAKAWVAKHNGYPEVGSFEDEKSLQKFYKQLDTEQIEEWASVEGVTFKACPDSAPIHRMRACMAVLGKHFPKQTASKPKSKYADYTTEKLVELAIENQVPFEVCSDDKILRMRAIMALRAAKVIE